MLPTFLTLEGLYSHLAIADLLSRTAQHYLHYRIETLMEFESVDSFETLPYQGLLMYTITRTNSANEPIS